MFVGIFAKRSAVSASGGVGRLCCCLHPGSLLSLSLLCFRRAPARRGVWSGVAEDAALVVVVMQLRAIRTSAIRGKKKTSAAAGNCECREQVEARLSCFHQVLRPVKTRAVGCARHTLVGPRQSSAQFADVRACWSCSAWFSSRCGTPMNKAFKPSVIVGCANMLSRKIVYGRPASIAS